MVPESSEALPAIPKTTQPLRILFVVDGCYPAVGGAEKQVRLLARAFADAGHVVQIVAPLLDQSMSRTDQVDGVPVERLAYPRIKLLGAALLCARYGVWLWSRRREFDAIHVNMARNLAAVCGILRPLLPGTVTVKISGAWEFTGGLLDPKIRATPLQRMYNWCIRRVDNLQCISEYTRVMLKAAGYSDDQILMVPNAVDLSRFSPRRLEERVPGAPVEIVYVGRLRPVKGVSVLVDAWVRVAAACNARLTIAGDGWEREALHKRARDAGLVDRIEWLGEVSDVPSVLAKADIYVQPSLQEGLPNAVLEAMGMGLPIVATKISGNEDVVEHEQNGLLVPASDPEALAAALLRLVADPALAAQMGRRSREMVEKRFGLAAVMPSLVQAYRGDPGRPRHPAASKP